MVKSSDVRPTKIVSEDLKTDIAMTSNNPKKVLEDAMQAYEEAVETLTGGKVLMKMERENASFVTDKGVKFTKEHPFNFVDPDEVENLSRQRFRKAYPEEIKNFYPTNE